MRFVLLSLFISLPVIVSPQLHAAESTLTMEEIIVGTEAKKNLLVRMGLDIAAVRQHSGGSKLRQLPEVPFVVEALLTKAQKARLQRAGFSVQPLVSDQADRSIARKGTRLFSSLAKKSIAPRDPERVYYSYDESGGIQDQLLEVTEQSPLATLVTIGNSVQGRPIWAVRLTRSWFNAGHQRGMDMFDLPSVDFWPKPESLFVCTMHAREWVSTQMCMRFIRHLAAQYGEDPQITRLLDTTAVWVVPVVNPDGYEYTFTHERYWRKNLRDNDGDGEITWQDGVDLNRNYPGHFGLDDEGSSAQYSSPVYRGPHGASEPETQAIYELLQDRRLYIRFVVSYHTYGNWILYPEGFQKATPAQDEPIFVALAGTTENPAILDSLYPDNPYRPGTAASLYPTNGEFIDWVYGDLRIPSFTVELTDNHGFAFPEDEEMLQVVFEDNLGFALSVAESALHPARPTSPVGIEAQEVYHKPLTASYRRDQNIQISARIHGLPPVLIYVIDGSWPRLARFERKLGQRYQDKPGRVYQVLQATVRGQSVGQKVQYWIQRGRAVLGPYDYTVEDASTNRILVLPICESEECVSTPPYLGYYTEALDWLGVDYDVWSGERRGAIPSYQDVLSHYDVVIGYTGDQFAGSWIPRELLVQMRDFLNFGGRAFITGQDFAGLAYAPWLAHAPDTDDDFFQYYLGALRQVNNAGMELATWLPRTVVGQPGDPVFGDLSFQLYGGDGAGNQVSPDSYVRTAVALPHYWDELAANYDTADHPFQPHSGQYYVYSHFEDFTHQRFGRTFRVPEDHESPTLSFWMSSQLGHGAVWFADSFFVEVSVVGTGIWTTLPELGGASSNDTGEACLSGDQTDYHPATAQYMDVDCDPIGPNGGEWHAITSNSDGWQRFEYDLSDFAGKEIEIHLATTTFWSNQRLGVFLDDIQLPGQRLVDFESGLGGWSASTPTSLWATRLWQRVHATQAPIGAALRTESTVSMGFGFEAVASSESRIALMDRVLTYLDFRIAIATE